MPSPPPPDSANSVRDADGVILGFDIGGTKTALLAFSPGEERAVASGSFDTPAGSEPEAFVELLRRESTAMLEGAKVKTDRVRAVGCAVPGQVDGDGLVLGAGNLGDWQRVPFRTMLESAWCVPAYVEQDANSGALGEMWRGAAQPMSDFVFLALGTGIGAGIVLGRRLHRGAHHAAGEAGDLVIDPHSLGQGERGEHNLAARIGSRALRKRALEATGHEMGASHAVSDARRDQRLGPIARDVVDDLAVVVVALSVLLDPEAILFGGGTAAAGEDLVGRVRARVKGELYLEPVLTVAHLGQEAQLYGAIAGARRRLDSSFDLSFNASTPTLHTR